MKINVGDIYRWNYDRKILVKITKIYQNKLDFKWLSGGKILKKYGIRKGWQLNTFIKNHKKISEIEKVLYEN